MIIINTLLLLMKTSFFKSFFFFVFIAITFSLLCDCFIKILIKFYVWFQPLLIQHSKKSNKLIIKNLIVITYKFYKKMSRFFYKIEPIRFETRNHGDYFSPELLSDISKHNLSSTLICFLILMFVLSCEY